MLGSLRRYCPHQAHSPPRGLREPRPAWCLPLLLAPSSLAALLMATAMLCLWVRQTQCPAPCVAWLVQSLQGSPEKWQVQQRLTSNPTDSHKIPSEPRWDTSSAATAEPPTGVGSKAFDYPSLGHLSRPQRLKRGSSPGWGLTPGLSPISTDLAWRLARANVPSKAASVAAAAGVY